MAGAVAIVIVLLLIPVGFLVSMGALAGLLGQLLTRDGEVRNKGSELLELNR
jgi:predicted branched-subunit amino acid permease